MAQIELSTLVGLTQSYIAKNYAAALIDKSKTAELKAYTMTAEIRSRSSRLRLK